VHWSDIHYALLAIVVDALISKRQYSEDDQDDSYPRDRFHTCASGGLSYSSALNDSNQNRRDGEKQQDMDESAESVGGGHSEEP
jgi:hypothetical protein